MLEKCCRCGKRTYLNEQKKCFNCVNINAKKYKRKRLVTPRFIAASIWLFFGVVEGLLSYTVLLNVDFGKFFSILYLIGFVCYIGNEVKEGEYIRYWAAPILSIIVKILLAVDIAYTWKHLSIKVDGILADCLKYFLTDFLDMVYSLDIGILMGLIVAISVFFLVPSVVYGSMFLIFKVCMLLCQVKKNREIYLRLNRIIDVENIMQPLKKIPSYDYENLFEVDPIELDNERNNIICEIRNSNIPYGIKQTLIGLVNNKDPKLMVDNVIRYYYCFYLNKMINESGIDSWCDTIKEDERSKLFALSIPTSVYGYITKRQFELSARVNQEINKPGKKFFDIFNQEGFQEWVREFQKDFQGINRGRMGEKRVLEELKKYENELLILSDIRIEVGIESFESDFIVISPFGIYVIEVKNIASKGECTIRIDRDGRWNKVYNNKKIVMESPVHQNERHVRCLEKYINKKLGNNLDNYIRAEGIVVIANDDVDIDNCSDNKVLRYNNIINTIRSKKVVYSENEMRNMHDLILEGKIPASKYEMPNYVNMYVGAKIYMKKYNYWKDNIEQLRTYTDNYIYNINRII